MKKVAIIGTVGVPAAYGGFETLAENLVLEKERLGHCYQMIVYCSAPAYQERIDDFHGAEIRYIPFKANGLQSIPYDILSILSALRDRCDTLLLLGHSGAFALPFLRLLPSVRVITNIDGIEWKRAKWGRLARWLLRRTEAMAVRYSDVVVTDNVAIRDYVSETFDRASEVIAYGGDHAVVTAPKQIAGSAIPPVPEGYALCVCRIEPENNVHMILDAFSSMPDWPLVAVGNWEASYYGQELRAKYAGLKTITLLDPIYDISTLYALRRNARVYVHGHSAGGTNPSLVEMMHFGTALLAYDCVFNRNTTEDMAQYFGSAAHLQRHLDGFNAATAAEMGKVLQDIAQRRYTWAAVARAYFDLFDDSA